MHTKKYMFVLLLGCLLVVGRDVQAQGATAVAIRITEVYYDTPGDDSREEWVELANLGTAVIPLGTISIGDEEKAGGGEGMARFPAEAEMAPGQVVVVAQTAVGFRALFGFNPDFEIQDSDTAVPDMRRQPLWGSGDVALANDGDELLLLDGLAVVDDLSYGDSTAVFTPAIGDVYRGQSIARVPANCDGDTAADWQPQQIPTPGTISLEGDCATPLRPEIADALPPIGAIQGSGDVAAGINQEVVFRGVVTAVTADRNTNNLTFYTLFVQDLPGFEDGDPATSDAIPIFLGLSPPSLQVGDQVRVSGQVTEFFGLTEIDDDTVSIQLEAAGVALPAPVVLDLPAERAARLIYLESLEGMRVWLDAAVATGPTYSGCGFAVMPANWGGERPFRRQTSDDPGPVLPIQHATDVDCGTFPDVKTGDHIGELSGVLTYTFDEYRLVTALDAAIGVTSAPLPPLPSPPTVADNAFSVATFNLENHFDAVDDTGTPEEPKPELADIAAKQTKLAHTISAALGCPTLLAVQEVENAALLTALAAETAVSCGFTYEVTHLESADVRGIDVALLTQPGRVVVETAVLQQSCTAIDTGISDPTIDCPAGEQPLYSRPPLQVKLTVDGEPLTAIVLHMKSKRGGEVETAPRRLAQAEHIHELVAGWLAADAAAEVIVMGDVNDYEQSPPLLALTADGVLTNVLLQVADEDRYSFNFGGVSQLIDGVLLSPALVQRVVAVAFAHVNADFPDAWATDLGDFLPYASSDHDPPLVVVAAAPMVATPTSPPPTPEAVVATATAVPAESGGETVVAGGWWLLGGAALLLAVGLVLKQMR